MGTYSTKPLEIERQWYLVDAKDKILGRLASQLALRLRGKHKVIYAPHVDAGDFLVVVNSSQLKVTGNKGLDKKYYRHSGYPGGISESNFVREMAKDSEKVLIRAVKGMLPKGPLGNAMIRKLKIYPGVEHPHGSQQPKPLDIH